MAIIAPGTGWEVFVYSGPADSFGTLLAQVPGWTALSIAPLGNDAGAGSITIPLSSVMFRLGGHTPDNTPILNSETLWRVTQDGSPRFDFLAETVTRTTVAPDETQVVTISGPGTAQALNWGMAMPSGWKTTGKWVSKLSGIHDPFDTPDPNNASKFVIDRDLWNLTTVSAVSIQQGGTVTVNALSSGAFLGGGPFDAVNSSFSASVQPVALGLPPALSVPTPIILAQASVQPAVFGGGPGTATFTGALAAEQGSGLILISQGTNYSKGMSAFDSAGNKYKFVTDAFTSGAGVAVWMSTDSKPVTPATTFGVHVGTYAQALRITILRVPPGWLPDAGFSFAEGTGTAPALPAQVLRSSPEMELVIVANGGGANLASSAAPYSILESSFGPGNLRMSVCKAASGSAGVAEGDSFSGVFPSAVPWVATGLSLYWAGGEFGVTASTTPAMNGSEVTEVIVKAASGPGYAMIALSYQQFYCQYQDNRGTVTTHVMSPGMIGPSTANGSAYNTSWAQYWRISCDILAGNVINGREATGDKLWRFWTSPDGALWTLQWTVRLSQLSFSPAAVNVFMGGAYQGSGAASQFTSLNSEVTNSPNAGPIFLSQAVMTSWLQLLTACQARGTIPFVRPAFTLTTDSGGVPWADSWSIQVPIGTDLLTLMQNYAGAIDGDWIMDPGFSLRAGQQGSIGTDRHTTIVFHEGEITSLGQTQARDTIGNIIVTADGSGVLYTSSSASSIAKWHQREKWLAAGGTITGQAAINVAAAGLGQLADEIPARVIQIPPNQPGKTVFRDFGIFDWIGVERGDFSATDSLRIIGITVTVDQDGAEIHELILQTYRQAKVQFLTYLVNKLGGQSAAALGSLSAATLNNGLPVVALGSQAFIDPPPITGAIGGSSAGLGIQSGLAASPEIATGGGIDGSLISGLQITQDQMAFTLPSGTNVTYSPIAPLTPVLNDVWYQTDQNGVIQAFNVWNGTQWVPFTVGPQAVSFTAADLGATGGVGIYYQADPPGGAVTDQSLWYDTSHGNRVSIYSSATGTWTPFKWGTGAINTGVITANEIATGTITAQQLATGTLTAQQISAGTITANEIMDGTLTAQQIAVGTLSAELLATGVLDSFVVNSFTINSVNINGGVITVSGTDDGVFGYGIPPLTLKLFHASTPWLCPAGVQAGDAYVFAAGGGGGNGVLGGGAGGSGGGCCFDRGRALVAGQTYYIGVGNGGLSGGPGSPGGSSWFNTTNTQGGLVAFGGQGGHADGQVVTGGGFTGSSSSGGGHTGGTSGGDTAQAGGGGGGGGGAGSGGNGLNGQSTGTIYGARGGSGGIGTYPGGNAGSGGNVRPGANGGDGAVPGGGGGGAGQGFNGGQGGDGLVILVYRATNPVTQLITSMTGLAGHEPVNGLPVPQGFYGPQLELAALAVQPAKANTGNGQYWANAFGTPQAATPGMTGSVPIVQTDGSVLAAPNNTSPVRITKAWPIPAGNAQVGTIYEINVPFNGVFETNSLIIAVSIDGSVSNLGGITTGGGAFTAGDAINGVFIAEMRIVTVGITGTVNFFSHGSIGVHAIESTGPNTNTIAMAGSNAGIAFDTTVAHDIRINVTWAGAATGQVLTGYGSKFTRSGP